MDIKKLLDGIDYEIYRNDKFDGVDIKVANEYILNKKSK